MDGSPGFSVHRILQARMLAWVAIPFSRGFSWPRDRILVSCIAGRFLTIWAIELTPVVCKVVFLFAGSSAGPEGKGPQFIFTWFALWAPWFILGMVAGSQTWAFHETGTKCCQLTEAPVQNSMILLILLIKQWQILDSKRRNIYFTSWWEQGQEFGVHVLNVT